MNYLNNISIHITNITKYCTNNILENIEIIKPYKYYICILTTFILLHIIGFYFVLNFYLLIYYIILSINNITNKNPNTDLLIIYGCCYTGELFLENHFQIIFKMGFEILICKLIFYIWLVHPIFSGYIKVYNLANELFSISTRKKKMNNNILSALEILEKRQMNQSTKLKKIFEFYEKLNTNLDNYEVNDKQIYTVTQSPENELNIENNSLYIHPSD